MKLILRWLLSTLLYLWAGFCVFLLVVIVLLGALILPFGSYEPLITRGCQVVLWLSGIRVKTEGEENFDPDETYIFMANHVNLFDVFVLGGYVPAIKRGVEASEHFSWPIWGWLVKRIGNIPIQRYNLDEAKKSLRAAEEAVRQNISIIILPEGHRTRSGGLQQFKKGPFHLAKAAGVPIVPMGMSGMWEIKQFKNPHWRPGTIVIKYGKIISAETVQSSSVAELQEITRQAIKGLIDYDETPRRVFNE